MIRRAFLTASAITMAGIGASGATLLSLTGASLELLPPEERELLNFRKEIEESLHKYPYAEKLAKNIATPAKILSREQTSDGFHLDFISMDGSRIILTSMQGVSSIRVC